MSRKLESLADMFGEVNSSSSSLKNILGITNSERKEDKKGIIQIEISKLAEFEGHPFKLYAGERLEDMIESIKEHGILLPLIVRPMEEKGNGHNYEILSGHNRVNAALIAGLDKVPCIVREGLTDEEAMLIVTETNLRQRSFADLSYSERAAVLTEHYNAIKQQGKRTDLLNEIEILSNTCNFNEKHDSSQVATQGRTDARVGQNYSLSKDTVARYLRVNRLSAELKDRLDNDEIPFIAAVDLSFLGLLEQDMVDEALQSNPSFKIDIKKADILKSLSLGKSLNEEKVQEILSGKYFIKSLKGKPKGIKVKAKIISKYFSHGYTQSDIEKIIDEALEMYFQKSSIED